MDKPPPEALFELAEPAARRSRRSPVSAGDCALHFAGTFRLRYWEMGSPNRTTQELDTLCLACLLLIADYGVRPNAPLIQELKKCIECLQTFEAWRYFDALPFRICLELLAQPQYGLDILKENFTHHNSGIRDWMFTLGWFARKHLAFQPDDSLDVPFSLLKNVEDTLGHWDKSLALYRALCPDRESFWRVTGDYEAEKMPEQYAQRMAWAREHIGEIEEHPDLIAHEIAVRRLITDYLFK